MKNRITKILTFVLAGLLLIGCLAGITAFAEDATAPTAEIVAKNVSYKGAMQILYAVDYDGVTEGQSVKLYFYDTKDATEPAYKKGIDADDTITLNDTTYSLVFSNGITPKDMRKPIYAKPVVENEDGSLAYEGEMLEYSIWQYAINRFSKSPSTEQYALYTALLDYGGALQRTLLGSSYTEEELALAGGYADEYYIIEVQKMLGVCPEGEPEFAASLSPDELIAGFNPADVVEMPKTYNELVFCGFTLEDGTPVGAFGADKTAISHSTLLVSKELIEIAKPGKHTILANYTNDYELVDFADGDRGNATLSTNHSIPEGEEYVYVNKPAKGSGSLKLTPHNKNGDVYFFEADVTWNGYTADTTHAEWFLKLTFNSTASQEAGGSDYSLHRTFFRIDADGNMGINGDNSLGTASAPAATLAVGESVNLRIEYEPKGVNADGKYLHDVRMYIDGELVDSSTNNTSQSGGKKHSDNTDFEIFALTLRGSGHTAACAYSLDNIICDSYYKGNPGYDFENGTITSNLTFDGDADRCTTESVDVTPFDENNKALKLVVSDNTGAVKNATEGTYQGYEVNNIKPYIASVTNDGVFEFSFDMYYDGLEAGSSDKMIQTIVARSSQYFQMFYFRITSAGKLRIETDTGTVSGTSGSAAPKAYWSAVEFTEGGFTNIKIIMTKDGENSAAEVFVNGVSLGKKITYYHPLATDYADPIKSLDWRFYHCNPTEVTAEDGTVTYEGYTLYLDNIYFKCIGNIVD